MEIKFLEINLSLSKAKGGKSSQPPTPSRNQVLKILKQERAYNQRRSFVLKEGVGEGCLAPQETEISQLLSAC